jgi:hypothetical protein
MSGNSLTESQLKEKADIVRVALVNRIRRTSEKYSITYQELSNSCRFKYNMRIPQQRKTFGQILGSLLREEQKAKRPLLTSIVYLSRKYIQGDGFFKLLHAENIGHTRGRTLKELKDYDFRRKLEAEAVDFWRNDSNYESIKDALKLE